MKWNETKNTRNTHIYTHDIFTSKTDNPLIARKFEIQDNVIPASNSTIGKCLFKLGHILSNKYYLETASQMANNIKNDIASYGPGYSNWATLITYHTYPFYEIAITGPLAIEKLNLLLPFYLPDSVISCSDKKSDLYLLKDRYDAESTYYFVCVDNFCKIPVQTVDELFSLLEVRPENMLYESNPLFR